MICRQMFDEADRAKIKQTGKDVIQYRKKTFIPVLSHLLNLEDSPMIPLIKGLIN